MVPRRAWTGARRPASVVHSLLDRFSARIQRVPEPLLARYAEEAIERCERSGSKDAPYVACALAVDAALWTDDRTLSSEARVETYSTPELVERFLL